MGFGVWEVVTWSLVKIFCHCRDYLYRLYLCLVRVHRAPFGGCCRCFGPAVFLVPYGVAPLLRLSLHLSVSFVSLCPCNRVKTMPAFSCISSSFLASNSSLGTPCGLLCALRQSSHSSLQNFGVSLSRKPVSWICSTLMSG